MASLTKKQTCTHTMENHARLLTQVHERLVNYLKKLSIVFCFLTVAAIDRFSCLPPLCEYCHSRILMHTKVSYLSW